MTKQAILLINLGSPNSTRVKDVRKYLRQFLMDSRVIDIPFVARWLLVNGIIATFRAPRSAKKYGSIWTEQGFPLIYITRELTRKVKAATEMPVYMCMRYGNPPPESAFRQIAEKHPEVEEVILFPLYPHYAMSSYETAVEHVRNVLEEGHWAFDLKVIGPYYKEPAYIKALAESIKPFISEDYDHLLFSYHGVPERHIVKSDTTGNHCLKRQDCCQTESQAHDKCYRHQVLETTRLVAEGLGLPANKYSISFQSRLGSDKWLGPATTNVLEQLPATGVKNLLVVTPAFVSDCLENLEEIQIEGRETFLNAGGNDFKAIPCLNLNDDWVNAVGEIIDGQTL